MENITGAVVLGDVLGADRYADGQSACRQAQEIIDEANKAQRESIRSLRNDRTDDRVR